MSPKRIALLAAALALVALGTAFGETPRRSGYSYIREITGDANVDSRWNGQVEARRNMPISAGDELSTGERTRIEIALADGTVLHVGGATRVRFLKLRGQQGEDDDFSAIDLKTGSIVLAASQYDEGPIPRIDTDDATIYLSAGSRARVNADPRRGTVVVTRYGSAEVRTRGGSHTVKAGSYLDVNGDEEPEIARGTFSRDRFDIWSADRFDLAADAHSASSRYVDEEYSGDAAVLDGYGDWNYNQTYDSYVWSPRGVGAGWSPYGNGCWYYTPAGLTWWSSDPWGWYPCHYGNWFWDAGWNRWCWSPASVYSPAWVYWGYAPGWVGWCPIGWYSGYSPWWNSYYKHWNAGIGRGGLYFSVHGTFATRTVDFRGWNFAGSAAIGTPGSRLDVVPGARIGDRLGSSIAVSSRTIVVNPRDGGTRDAIQNYVREAPRVIARYGDDSGRLAPVLARQKDLPPSSVDALRDRMVLPARGRLEGPGVADLAPRGAYVDRSRTLADPRGREAAPIDRGQASEPPSRPSTTTAAPRSPSNDNGRRDMTVVPQDWRDRGRTVQAPPPSSQAPAAPQSGEGRPSVTRTEVGRKGEDWRSRPDDMPPARRVIEGAVPGHRREYRADDGSAPREYRRNREPDPAYSSRRYEPQPQVQRQAPSAPPRIEPRNVAPPAHAQPQAAPPRQAPAPVEHHSAPAPAPPRKDRG